MRHDCVLQTYVYTELCPGEVLFGFFLSILLVFLELVEGCKDGNMSFFVRFAAVPTQVKLDVHAKMDPPSLFTLYLKLTSYSL